MSMDVVADTTDLVVKREGAAGAVTFPDTERRPESSSEGGVSSAS